MICESGVPAVWATGACPPFAPPAQAVASCRHASIAEGRPAQSPRGTILSSKLVGIDLRHIAPAGGGGLRPRGITPNAVSGLVSSAPRPRAGTPGTPGHATCPLL